MYYLLYYCCITNFEVFFFQIVVFTTSNMMLYKEGWFICFQESRIFCETIFLEKPACARLLTSVISFLVYSQQIADATNYVQVF